MQAVGEMLLSQALLPIVASQRPSIRTSSREEAGGARVLQWSRLDEAAPGDDGSVEEALLAVLHFIAGENEASH